MALGEFHPIIQDWFRSRFSGPTEPQQRGWPAIASGRDTLIAAPTGSGKTFTAFLAVIDRLLRAGLNGHLPEELRVVYVSPLRALSNDMHRNLEVPLREIAAVAGEQGISAPAITVGLRTGDTPSHKRAALSKRPPHILVTTPESLYLMLTAERSREALRTVETLIVDEIHALVRDKRGSHLALSMERLEALTGRTLQRIGLSATQKPIERMARFLVGDDAARIARLRPEAAVVDVGHQRDLDLGIEVPPSELGAVCSHEQWAEVNARLVELIESHRSTLIFVNTRRLAERLTFQLTGLLGDDVVGAHHGSLSAGIRFDTEQRLKQGTLKAVVATASLELGIDVGYIDLVVQIGSPRSIATFLQRVGRSGHALGLTPKGRLFALTRDELLECMALVRTIRAGRLDVTPIPQAPLDILAQQIVAEVSAQEWSTEELFALCRRAWPYRGLERRDFDRILELLSEGLTTTSGRSRCLLHHDRVHGRLRGRRGARLTAINNGGAIAEVDAVRVVAEPEMTVVGSVDEDFAVEGSAGDIFLLGNTSWRMQQLRGNDLIVSDAHGAPPTIPFWRGEAPGRTVELSEELSRLREEISRRVRQPGGSEAGAAPGTSPSSGASGEEDRARLADAQGTPDELHEAVYWLAEETNCPDRAARQAVEYVAAQQAAVGMVPTQTRVLFERFFDESGGMQLVVHAPFGGRINRAWGLAMRKRFCRSFDFELQATADDDGFILSLGPQHSFPIESLFPMLRTDNVRTLLEQALLAVPMFHLRWRWNVTRSLQLDRMRNGRKVPPALQRFRSEDLLTAVFPKLTGCQEEHTGDHVIPDHPLIQQTVDDCLQEALDLDGLLELLTRVERQEITFVAKDTREPSPFAYELLNANPYAFLDGGEIQERRARAVATRRSLSIESLQDLGRLDPQAISLVVREAQPLVRDADELHDLLLSRIVIPAGEAGEAGRFDPDMPRAAHRDDAALPEGLMHDAALAVAWTAAYQELEWASRATTFVRPNGRRGWVAAERLPALWEVFPDAVCDPPLTPPAGVPGTWTAVEARVAMVRGLMEVAGPVTAGEVAGCLGLGVAQTEAALERLEGEGVVLRGRFRSTDSPRAAQSCSVAGLIDADRPAAATGSGASAPEWCHRRLLARIHRLTVAGLRREIEPVDVRTFVRFLTRHQGLLPGTRRAGANGLFEVIAQLQGLDLPVIAWEGDILPQRVEGYRPAWLDELCLTGEVGWGRLYPPPRDVDRSRPMASITRVAPVSLFVRQDLNWLLSGTAAVDLAPLSGAARELLERLRERGASFAADLMQQTRLLATQIDDALGELVTRGIVTSDGFTGLRRLTRSAGEDPDVSATRRGSRSVTRRRSAAGVGRWSIWRPLADVGPPTGQDAAAKAASGSAVPVGRLPEDPRERREIVEQWAWQLLRRWGVVFRDLVQKETGGPSWWELAQTYRRLEAQGEIRGGRFVAGVAGEQFALGDTVRELRQLRGKEADGATSPGELVVLSAADPLNITGILGPEARVPARPSNVVALLDGELVAHIDAGTLIVHPTCPEAWREPVRSRLNRCVSPESAAEQTSADQFLDRHARRFARKRRTKPPDAPSGIPRPIIS